MESPKTPRSHWIIVCAVAVLICLLRILPYFTAPSTPDRTFLGFAYSIEDTLQYADFVAQGKDGNLLLSNHFSLMEEKPRMIVLCTSVIGWLASLLGMPVAAAWTLAHSLLILGFFVTLYWLLGVFFKSPGARLFAFLFMAFAGGLDGLIVLLDPLLPDSWIPVCKKRLWPVLGWTPYMTTYNPVYLSGLILLMVFIRVLMRGLNGSPTYLITGAILIPLMYLNHAYDAAVAGGLTIMLLMHPVMIRLDGRAFVRDLKKAGIVLAGILPVIAVVLWQSQDPLLGAASASSHSGRVESPVMWLLGFGAVFLAALYGTKNLASDTLRSKILFGWILTASLLSFMPIFEGRHFLYFVSLPLYILAVDGLILLKDKLTLTPRARAAVIAILTILLCNSFIRITIRNFTNVNRDRRMFASIHDLKVADHLKTLPPGGILSSRESGMWLPHRTGRRVVMGHWFLTPDLYQRQQALKLLLNPKTSPAERDRLLLESRARYFFYGPREQSLGPLPVTYEVALLPLHKEGPTMLFAIGTHTRK